MEEQTQALRLDGLSALIDSIEAAASEIVDHQDLVAIKGELFRHEDHAAHSCPDCALRARCLQDLEQALAHQACRIAELEQRSLREAVEEVGERLLLGAEKAALETEMRALQGETRELQAEIGALRSEKITLEVPGLAFSAPSCSTRHATPRRRCRSRRTSRRPRTRPTARSCTATRPSSSSTPSSPTSTSGCASSRRSAAVTARSAGRRPRSGRRSWAAPSPARSARPSRRRSVPRCCWRRSARSCAVWCGSAR